MKDVVAAVARITTLRILASFTFVFLVFRECWGGGEIKTIAIYVILKQK